MAKAWLIDGAKTLVAALLAAFAVASSASAGVDFGQSGSSSYPSQQSQNVGAGQAQVSGQNLTAEREAALEQIKRDLNETGEHIRDYASLAGKDLQERAEGEIRGRVQKEVPGPGTIPALGAIGLMMHLRRRQKSG